MMTPDDWSVVTGISTVVIALCALVLSIWQGCVAREHNRLSVRPHLTTWTQRDAERGSYVVELVNNGIGPAVIEDFSIRVDGRLIPGDGVEALEKSLKIVFPDLPYRAHQSYLAKGYVMAPKERCAIFAVQFTGHPLPSREFVEHAIRRGTLEINYTSLYGDALPPLRTEDAKSEKPTSSRQI